MKGFLKINEKHSSLVFKQIIGHEEKKFVALTHGAVPVL